MTSLHFVTQYTYRTLCGLRTDDKRALPFIDVRGAGRRAERVLCEPCAVAAGIEWAPSGQLELL